MSDHLRDAVDRYLAAWRAGGLMRRGLPSFASRLRPPIGRRAGGAVIAFPTAEPEEPDEPREADEGESPPDEAPPLAAVG